MHGSKSASHFRKLKDGVRRPLSRAALRAHAATTDLARRLTPEARPRSWSNTRIAEVAATVKGDVVHVSAWRDEDKDGRCYREYFPGARSYTTTNVGGSRGEGLDDSIHLDLTAPLQDDLRRQFDFVLNHTTLEHIYELDCALTNLFELSRDAVMIVVPFMQVEHWEAPAFGDFWRFGQHALATAAVNNGFEVVSLCSNHNPVWPIYYALHARRSSSSDLSQGRDLWEIMPSAPGFNSRLVDRRSRLMS